MKTINPRFYLDATHSEELGKRIFQLKIPYLLNSEGKVMSSKSITSVWTILGAYEWEYDLLTLFYNKIRVLCEKYRVDYKSTFEFCFCHEVGHAKQQRLFESIGYFPNKFKVWPEGVPVEIESTKYIVTEKFSVSSKPFWDAFSCHIQDFAINEEMLRNSIKNELCRPIAFDLSNQPISTSIPRHFMVLESLVLLPHDIDVFEHGGFLQDERRQFMEFKKRVVGEKWSSAYALLKSINFADPESLLRVTIDMFKEILGTHASLGFRPERRNSLFRNYPTFPKYWNKDRYNVIFLT